MGRAGTRHGRAAGRCCGRRPWMAQQGTSIPHATDIDEPAYAPLVHGTRRAGDHLVVDVEARLVAWQLEPVQLGGQLEHQSTRTLALGASRARVDRRRTATRLEEHGPTRTAARRRGALGAVERRLARAAGARVATRRARLLVQADTCKAVHERRAEGGWCCRLICRAPRATACVSEGLVRCTNQRAR